MDRRSWLWRRRSTEKGSADSESSVSSPSERLTDERDTPKSTPSPEISTKEAQDNENVKVKVLSERLSSAVLDVRAKDDLVKQHSKVAEEAVLGWEKAEKENASLKAQLNAAAAKNSTLEERIGHLDGALKECVRQLRRAKEDQDQKVQDALAQQARRWESEKTDLELRIIELKAKLEAKSELSLTSDGDASSRLGSLEKENAALKVQLLARTEELELRTIEKELSRRSAETARKHQLEGIKKMTKLEAECRRLQANAARSSSIGVELWRAPSSVCTESVTDCNSDCSDSWASAMVTELDQFKNDQKSFRRSASLAAADINMMDDFLEMEKLASAPKGDAEDATGQLLKFTAEKTEREKELHESQRELRASRRRAAAEEERSAELQRQLNLANGDRRAAEAEAEAAETRRLELERELELAQADAASLKERLESEKALTLELAAKYQRTDALESEREELRVQLDASRSDTGKLTAMAASLERSLGEEKASSARLAESLRKQESSMEVQRNELKSQLQSAGSEIVGLNEKVRTLEESVAKHRPLVSELESQLRSAQAEIKNLEENVGLLEKKLESQKNLSSAYITALDASEAQKNRLTSRFELKEREAEELHIKIGSLEEQIREERAQLSEFAAQCQNLKEEISSRAPGHQPVKHVDNKDLRDRKEKELDRAAGKLADCQKTIASLSSQLKSLADFDGFVPEVEKDGSITESWDGDLKLFDSTSYPSRFGCLAVT